MCDIIFNTITKRGLSIKDSEFKIRGMIFFSKNIINYRDIDNIYLLNEEKKKYIFLMKIY